MARARQRDDEPDDEYEARMETWRQESSAFECLKEAIEEAVGTQGDTNRKLGRYIKSRKDRKIEGLAFRSGGVYQGAFIWRVSP